MVSLAGLIRPELSRTVDGGCATKLGESTHGAMVLLGEGVLDGRDEKTGTGGDGRGLDCGAQSVLGVVLFLLLGGHVEV